MGLEFLPKVALSQQQRAQERPLHLVERALPRTFGETSLRPHHLILLSRQKSNLKPN
jgi:hypothetical protein